MKHRPYLCIPNLIIQPTWGGDYIRAFKGLNHPMLVGQKIGQSYELYESTHLSYANSFKGLSVFEIGNSEQPDQTKVVGEKQPLAIQTLIKADPIGTLGRRAIAAHGEKMGVLIKFTQAKGNSYQLHVRKDNAQWQTKPESWYYFEDGIVTLGIKPGTHWDAYQAACLRLESAINQISQNVKSGKLSLHQAETEIKSLLQSENIEQYVNRVEVKKGQAIDLSPCGIHHSWEEDEKRYPLGNVLYEVQKNTYDPVSTIRSFDKGKLKSDGSVRPLQINDYFAHVDRSPEANNPATHLVQTITLLEDDHAQILEVFKSPHYQMHQLQFMDTLPQEHAATNDSFHHLFIQEGEVQLIAQDTHFTLDKGVAVFIPAAITHYQLIAKDQAKVLKTFV